MSYRITFFLFVAILAWSACVPPREPEPPKEITLNVQDSLFQRVSNLRDRRDVEGLYAYRYHPNPFVRYQAARAFGSIPGFTAVDSLADMLRDPVPQVRAAAAFALGQTGESAAVPLLLGAFEPQDTAMRYAEAQRAILEAVGKCGDAKLLNQLSAVTTYLPTDTMLLEGQAYGIYRFGLRDINTYAGTKRAVDLCAVDTYPRSVRLVAANYLARSATTLDTFTASLIQIFEAEPEPAVRMALALALGKTRRSAALTALVGQYGRERDYRVQCNILRALSNFPYEQARALVTEALRDPNEHVARRAAQYLLEQSTGEDAALWWRFAKDSLPTPIHLELYRVANRHLPAFRVEIRDALNAELRQRYQGETNPYRKATILMALSEFPWNYRYIFRESELTEDPIVQTAAFTALQEIGMRKDFAAFFGLSARRVTRELAGYFQAGIRGGAAGPVAIASQALRGTQRDYRSYIDSVAVLEHALQQLELPAAIESYNELAQTIAYLKGEADFSPLTVEYNNPIDWGQFKGLGPRPRLLLNTTAGELTLELWPEVAPGSVANLLQLARAGFFDDKAFHRVVANFVVQGGSPTGDAYGSLDYTIRSEFSDAHYDRAGLLGMASAGPDTEGTQFFITHSPTLHLDGRYTVFGQVVAGMDALHAIQVGDVVRSCQVVQE
jgi:cyclophilin family peptidyl-prolyl cis-trans isomerase/HEAT repeat protein